MSDLIALRFASGEIRSQKMHRLRRYVVDTGLTICESVHRREDSLYEFHLVVYRVASGQTYYYELFSEIIYHHQPVEMR